MFMEHIPKFTRTNRGRLEITDASGNVTEGYMYLEMGRIDFYIPSEKPEKDVYNPIQ